jgi:alpha-1,3-rhamnosyl/mannosyltransferase
MAAIVLSPEDTEGWAQAMLQLAINKAQRERLVELSHKQASQFDSKQSASSLIQLYMDALDAPKRKTISSC